MKKSRVVLLLIMISIRSWGQSLSPFAISSSGGFFAAGGNSLSSTVGEMTMVETFHGGTSFLTQGFQQPNDLNVGFVKLSSDYKILVYPNPNHGSFIFMISLKKDAAITMKIYDALGREVFFDKLNFSSGVNQAAIQLNDLTDGIYWMELQSEDNMEDLSHHTQKINIIH